LLVWSVRTRVTMAISLIYCSIVFANILLYCVCFTSTAPFANRQRLCVVSLSFGKKQQSSLCAEVAILPSLAIDCPWNVSASSLIFAGRCIGV
jgi:hypothetical protein